MRRLPHLDLGQSQGRTFRGRAGTSSPRLAPAFCGNSQWLAIVFWAPSANPAPDHRSGPNSGAPNVKLAVRWQFLRSRLPGALLTFKDLRNGIASAKGKGRRSGAQRGALENNFGQRFS
jgi:hypothetical protein